MKIKKLIPHLFLLVIILFCFNIFFPIKVEAVTFTPGTVTSCGTLSAAGDYYLQYDLGTTTPVSGTCFPITDNNVVFHGNGHTIYGAANSISFDASTSTTATNAYGTTTIDNLTTSGFTKAFQATGGVNDNTSGAGLNNGVGANGGSVIISNSNLSGSVTTIAGTNTNRSYAQAGLGGNILISTSTVTGTITTQGGNGWGFRGDSGLITITNSTIIGTTTSAGGSGYNGVSAGVSAPISITNSTVGNIVSMGGSNNNNSPGAAGSITIASSTIGSIQNKGGLYNGTGFTGGGNAGNITLTNNSIILGNISTVGGNGYPTYSSSLGGNGGNIYIGTNNNLSNIFLTSAGGTGYATGTRGTLTIVDSGTTIHSGTTLSAFSDLVLNGIDEGAYAGGSWPVPTNLLQLNSPVLASDGKTLTSTISGGSGNGNSPSSDITGLTVKAGGITHLISSSSISGSVLTIVLAAPIANTPTTLSIATSSNLTDSDANTPTGQTNISVTNNSTQVISTATTRGEWMAQGLSNGTDTALNSRVTMIAPYAATGLSLVYGNVYGSSETVGTNPITISGAIEYNGTSYPVTWAGATSILIQPGQVVVTDPIVGLSVPVGATIYARTHLSVASAGQKWPIGLTYAQTIGDGYESGSSGASQIDKTTLTGGLTSDPFLYGYSPLAVVGNIAAEHSSVCIYGDSIAYGQGEGNDAGYITDAIGSLYPYIRIAIPGSTMSQLAAASTGSIRQSLAQYCTHSVVQDGTNDSLTNLSAFQANALKVYQGLITTNSTIKTYQTTITPRTTSTDNWSTTVNQTPVSGFGPSGGQVGFNNWLRDGAPIVNGTAVVTGTTPALRYGQSGNPLAGYFEVADIDESSHNSGLWKVNGTANYATGDGIHPTATMHQLMKAGISLSSFNTDTAAPALSSISAELPSTTATTISWTSDEAASSEVIYGLTNLYGSSTIDLNLVASHSVSLSNLLAGTTYHYQVVSQDASGNTATSTDQTFTTASVSNNTSSSGGGSGYIVGYNLFTPAISAPIPCLAGELFNTSTGQPCSSISTTTMPIAWLFTRDLQVDTVHPEVKLLQQYLNTKGFVVSTTGAGSVGNETTFFGSLTKAALIKFQKAKDILPSSGYFGPITRAYISSH